MLSLLIVFGVSFFQKDQYKNIESIQPEILQEPTQSPTTSREISFERDGYSYILTPLYDYTIQGLAVSTQPYDTWYNLSRVAKTFTKDICLIWGETVEKRGYQDKTLKISQDFRFCLYEYWSNELVFNANELSNSHLIPRDAEVEKKIRSIQAGDQIRMRGKLVNVDGTLIDVAGKYEREKTMWQTSISRDDTGAGACEVMYVEEIEILQKGNILYCWLYNMSLFGILMVIFLKICFFFLG